MSEFAREIESIAARTLEVLSHVPTGDSITAWELKLKVKAPLSPLYMALGVLQERGRVQLQLDGLNYRILPTANAAKPISGVPLEIAAPTAPTGDIPSAGKEARPADLAAQGVSK